MKRAVQNISKHRVSKNGNPINKAFGIWESIKGIDGVSYVRNIRDGANKRMLRLKMHR